MTTTKKQFRVTGKTLLWTLIPTAIVLVGLVIFLVFGFNPSSTITDSRSLAISYDSYITASDDLEDHLLDVCNEQIDAAGMDPVNYTSTETSTGGSVEYYFTADTTEAELTALWEDYLQDALEQDSLLGYSTFTATVHTNITQTAYEYIWRAAISVAVVVAIAFLYVFIRYKFSMGVATAAAAVFDVLMMLALTAILRVPVTTSLATGAVFASLYSVLISTISFNKIRALLKTEEYAALSTADAMEKANGEASRLVLLIGIVAVVFFGLLAIFAGSAVRSFALPVILGVLASTYSGIFFTPSLTTSMRVKGDKMRAKREEKERIAKQQEEEERAKKRATKKA